MKASEKPLFFSLKTPGKTALSLKFAEKGWLYKPEDEEEEEEEEEEEDDDDDDDDDDYEEEEEEWSMGVEEVRHKQALQLQLQLKGGGGGVSQPYFSTSGGVSFKKHSQSHPPQQLSQPQLPQQKQQQQKPPKQQQQQQQQQQKPQQPQQQQQRPLSPPPTPYQPTPNEAFSSLLSQTFSSHRSLTSSHLIHFLTIITKMSNESAQKMTDHLMSNSVGVSSLDDLLFLEKGDFLEGGGGEEEYRRMEEWWGVEKGDERMRGEDMVWEWLRGSVGICAHMAMEYYQLLVGEEVGISSFDDLFYLDEVCLVF